MSNSNADFSLDWSRHPVSAIGEFCQKNGWAFVFDAVEPWVDLRFAAYLYGVGRETLRTNYCTNIPKIKTHKGLLVRLSDLNAARAKGEAAAKEQDAPGSEEAPSTPSP